MRASGGRSLSASAAATDSGNRGELICRPDRLTEMLTSQPPARQDAACPHAVDSTQAPSGTISPESSATSRKSDGGTAAPSRHQRTRASAPVTWFVSRSTTGWY